MTRSYFIHKRSRAKYSREKSLQMNKARWDTDRRRRLFRDRTLSCRSCNQSKSNGKVTKSHGYTWLLNHIRTKIVNG